jgi:hypothetical protein
MPYTSRCAAPELTVEEMDVAAALRRYGSAGAIGFDWTPSAALWQTYLDWWAIHRWRYDPNAPPRLTRRQFGRAVRRVFAGAERRKRSFQAKRQWGYARLVGPWSVVTPPPRHKNASPKAAVSHPNWIHGCDFAHTCSCAHSKAHESQT